MDREMSQEIENLENRIMYHRFRYHILKDPEINDEDYDRLLNRLIELKSRYGLEDAPTYRWKRDLKRYVIRDMERLIELLNIQRDRYDSFIVEPLLKGVEVDLLYREGRLISAISEDDELFLHMSTILDVPLHIFPLYDNLTIPPWLTVGIKVYMERQDLNTLNSALQSRGIRGFKDTFHATSHSLKTDPRITARRPLKIFCYWAKADFGCEFKNQIELISYLQNLGFRINRTMISTFSNPYDIEEIHKEIRDETDELPYDVEGMVIRENRPLKEDGTELFIRFLWSQEESSLRFLSLPTPSKNIFKGKKVCLSGSLNSLSWNEIREYLESLGAKLVHELSSDTDLLILGDAPGLKLREAKEMGIEIIDEATFFKILEG